MKGNLYRYTFKKNVDLTEVESSIVLALMSVQSLHGEAQVRLDAAHYLDRAKRACVIDATTEVGEDLNRLFIGYLQREFGDEQFTVERLDKKPCHDKEAPKA